MFLISYFKQYDWESVKRARYSTRQKQFFVLKFRRYKDNLENSSEFSYLKYEIKIVKHGQ